MKIHKQKLELTQLTDRLRHLTVLMNAMTRKEYEDRVKQIEQTKTTLSKQ